MNLYLSSLMSPPQTQRLINVLKVDQPRLKVVQEVDKRSDERPLEAITAYSPEASKVVWS